MWRSSFDCEANLEQARDFFHLAIGSTSDNLVKFEFRKGIICSASSHCISIIGFSNHPSPGWCNNGLSAISTSMPNRNRSLEI